jgi:hypothetical protein
MTKPKIGPILFSISDSKDSKWHPFWTNQYIFGVKIAIFRALPSIDIYFMDQAGSLYGISTLLENVFPQCPCSYLV